jgi:hypothetical protein
VGPRAGLDAGARRKILCPCRGSNLNRPIVQPVVRHYTYCLSYRGSPDSTKHKEKQGKDEEINKQKAALRKFFTFRPSGEEAQVCASTSETGNSDTDIIFQKADDEISSPECNESFNISDAATWSEHIDDDTRCAIVRHGPAQIESDAHFTFPANEKFAGRGFKHNYFGKLKNGEKVERCWLVYSMKANAVLFYCCKLFSPAQHHLCKDGFRAWQYIHKTLKSHEGSSIHMECMANWKKLEIRLKTRSTIDNFFLTLREMERCHLASVFERLVAILIHVAERNTAFRGTVDKLYSKSDDNFLSQIELMTKFDPIMKEHVRCFVNNENSRHYLGHRVQNELVQLSGRYR